MQRGEKRAMPPDGNPDDSAASPTAHASKKAKLPDFDWSANNYELTWRLVNELVKPENKPVLFPEIEGMRSVTGETKEDVYRRIAKVVHPEAYAQDPHTAGSRMKNKNMSMWKEYSGYCRKLHDLCSAHRTTIPSSGPDASCPPIIQEEWRRIMISMPAFAKLYTFMPIRSEDKPKTSTHMKPPSLRSTPVFSLHTPMDEDHIMDRGLEHHSVSACNSPAFVTSPREVPLGKPHAVNGKLPTPNGIMNAHGSHERSLRTPATSSDQASSHSFQNLLDLYKLYQEDFRLGIFSTHETKRRIEELEKKWERLANSQEYRITPLVAPLPSSAGPLLVHNHLQTNGVYPLRSPSPESEQQYNDKATMLGFCRPSAPHPLADLSSRDRFKAILDHAADCKLPECQLDNRNLGKRTPRLIFTANPHERGHVQIAISTLNGPEPLVNHAPAACARFMSRNTITIMNVTLVIHKSAGWDTTLWDHANAVVGTASNRRLSLEEIKTIQSNMHLISDFNVRKKLEYLNENSSTLFDVLRTGQLQGNSWEPLATTEDGTLLQH